MGSNGMIGGRALNDLFCIGPTRTNPFRNIQKEILPAQISGRLILDGRYSI